MTEYRPISKRLERTILGAILLLFGAICAVGITWGLPSRKIDQYLFGHDEPWSGEKIYRLAGAAKKLMPGDAARELMENDPAVKGGIFTAELRPYRVALLRGQ